MKTKAVSANSSDDLVIKHVDEGIFRDSVNLLYNSIPMGIGITFIAFVILQLWFNNYDLGIEPVRLVFIIAISTITLFRLVCLVTWKKNKQERSLASVKNGFYLFFIGSILSSVCWSLYAVGLLDYMSYEEASSVLTISAALGAGAATVLSASRIVSTCYIFVMLMPLSIALLLSKHDHYHVMGILGIVFFYVMYHSAKNSSAFTSNALNLSYQNVALLKTMEYSNQQVIEANKGLEQKVDERTKQIFALSFRDPLTQLFNRKAFFDNLNSHLDMAKKQKSQLALLFIDLDGFKAVNDGHGHQVGDAVLKEIASRLTSFVQSDNHLCRWGGDEFVLVIEGKGQSAAHDAAVSLLNDISKPMEIDLLNVALSATIGIAMYPKHSHLPEELIACADTAMFHKKELSKSGVAVFDNAMREDQLREYYLKNGLAEALENQEFYLVYQPVIDNKSGNVDFCEVLLRWHHKGEDIPPCDFIKVAESYGFIHKIGAWVVQQACYEVKDWVFGKDVGISVNVSIMQFQRQDLVKVIVDAMNTNGISPKNVSIEITESLFAEHNQPIINQVRALQELGVGVSLDDFGTGFSSLSQLQALAADTVKIDKSFVDTLDSGGKAIIQATQYMADELSYTVVAEGVETQQQADVLNQMGIKSSQGYLYAKPMRLNELAQWYKNYKNQRAN